MVLDKIKTMKYNKLGKTNLKVSEICLGTMTWGEQNSEDEGHSQLDCSIERGINFIDAAEMYPVPPKADTCNRTEKILGTWLTNRQDRDKIYIATKISGKTAKRESGPPGLEWIRKGPNLSKGHIDEAIEGSLKRLQTEYIDLYQIHWPERVVNNFGSLGYKHKPREDDTPIRDTLEALAKHVDNGNIKYIGLSNETPWGVMQFINLANIYNLPRVVSIQNPYNLLNRSFEVGLSEVAMNEDVGLLAYSPLAFGVLSGKYIDDSMPKNSRLSLFPMFKRYMSLNGKQAVKKYLEIANDYKIDLVHLALSFVNSQDFVTSNIIGATNINQLENNINSTNTILNSNIYEEIEKIHKIYTYPCP